MNNNSKVLKWHHLLLPGTFLFVFALFFFWQSLTAPFGFLFWVSLDSAFFGLALLLGGIGGYLKRHRHRLSKVLGIGSLILASLLLFSIPIGFFVQDNLYELILLTEVADSPWQLTELSLDVTIRPEKEQISVTGDARLTLNECCSQSIILSLPRQSMIFDSVTSGGNTVDIYRDGSLANVKLPETYQAGEIVDVLFTYHNKVNRLDNVIVPFTDFVVEENFAYVVEPYPWYPMPFGSRGPVSAEVAINVPEGWTTLANGIIIGSHRESDGRTQEMWHTQSPAALSFVAGPYHVAREEINSQVYAVYTLNRPLATGESGIASLETIVDILESYFGPSPTSGYAVIEAPSEYIHHSAESQIGYLVSDANLLFPNDELGIAVTAHEFAHGWWGEYVENVDPGNKMVNEALAEYSATLVIEQLEGRVAMIDFLRFNDPDYALHQSAQWYFTNILGTDQDVPLIEATHLLANAKGRWFYHMLRNRVGDKVFFGSLREILVTHGGKTASMHDIQAIFEKNSPPATNVGMFFDQWMEQPGVPQLEYTWDIDEVNDRLTITIRQVEALYNLFVEIGYQDDQGDHIEVIHITQAEETFTLQSEGSVRDVALDPNHESLILFPERKQEYERNL